MCTLYIYVVDPRLGLHSCCRGRIEQVGTPKEILERPATPFVMNFIADVNQLPSTSQVRPSLPFRPEGTFVATPPALNSPYPDYRTQCAHQLAEILG